MPLLCCGWECVLVVAAALVASFGHHRRAMRVCVRGEGSGGGARPPRCSAHVVPRGKPRRIGTGHPCDAGVPCHPRSTLAAHGLLALRLASPSVQRRGQRHRRLDRRRPAVLPDDLPTTWRTWFSSVPLRALALAKYDLWPNLLAACRPQPSGTFAARHPARPQPQALDPHALETRHDDHAFKTTPPQRPSPELASRTTSPSTATLA